MPDLCRYCSNKGKQSLGVLTVLGIFKPGIDVIVPLKAIVHLLGDSGNKSWGMLSHTCYFVL